MTTTTTMARVRPPTDSCCDPSDTAELADVGAKQNVGEHGDGEANIKIELNVMEGSAVTSGSGGAPSGGDAPWPWEADEDPVAEVDEMVCEPCEVRIPKTLFDPMLPSPQEVADHNITHTPPRRWCPICVQGSGKEHPHLREKDAMEDREGLPEFGMDYDS